MAPFRETGEEYPFWHGETIAGYIDMNDGALYVLSQYCDQLVNDGYGGQEPKDDAECLYYRAGECA